MLKYVLKRFLYMLFVFFVMSILLFFVYNLVPGDPARMELEDVKTKLKPAEYEKRYLALRKQYGLDDPMYIRYGKWAGKLIKGDLGESRMFKKDVKEVIKGPLSLTISINFFAIIIGLAITIPLGIMCAVKKNSVFDQVTQVLTVIGYSIPVFIIALVFVYFFAVKLRWFPVNGMSTPGKNYTGFKAFTDLMLHLALPLMIMTFGSLGGMTRYVRAAMNDALSMDYIKTARAKGLREKTVIYSHAWRNALLPVVTLIVSWFMSIFSGSIIIESMFNLNGMGKFYIDALNNKDFNLAIAIQLFYIIITLVGNLITDLSYGIVDPRVRVDS